MPKQVLELSWNAYIGSPSEWCVVIALDVKNAFNIADWGRILDTPRGKRVSPYLMNVISDYLTDRGISISIRGPPVGEVNQGVPQGSIFGTGIMEHPECTFFCRCADGRICGRRSPGWAGS